MSGLRRCSLASVSPQGDGTVTPQGEGTVTPQGEGTVTPQGEDTVTPWLDLENFSIFYSKINLISPSKVL